MIWAILLPPEIGPWVESEFNRGHHPCVVAFIQEMVGDKEVLEQCQRGTRLCFDSPVQRGLQSDVACLP